MQTASMKHGIVAYFDILGYKTFACVESDEDISKNARLLSERLLQIRRRISEQFPNHAPLFIRDLEWCIFSDTILLWFEIPKREFEAELLYWHMFLQVCNALMQVMFNDGFPLRAAISEGGFSVEDHSFIGRPIMQCEHWANQTEWSGCVLTKRARTKLEALWSAPGANDERKLMEQVCVNYPVPWKKAASAAQEQARESSSLVLKWFHVTLSQAPEDVAQGIPGEVQRSFEAHGKDISSKSVRCKLANTIDFLAFVDTLYANSNDLRKKPVARPQTRS
jgi:hypothetical protein